MYIKSNLALRQIQGQHCSIHKEAAHATQLFHLKRMPPNQALKIDVID